MGLPIGPRCKVCDRRGCPGHTTIRMTTDGNGRQLTGKDPHKPKGKR